MFKFIVWLRWPTRPCDHPAAMMSCIVAYIYQKHSVETIDQLDNGYKDLLLRHRRLNTLKQICSDESLFIPSFSQWKYEGQPNTDLDWIATIAWFFLAYEARSAQTRDAVSLGKAYYAIQSKIFQYKWPIAFRTFKSHWAALGVAAPFHYIERFHVSMEFTLDPASSYFGESVKNLIDQPVEIRRYLARARWVIEALSTRLDQRTLDTISFPSFPVSLRPEPVTIPPLPSHASKVMSAYRSR